MLDCKRHTVKRKHEIKYLCLLFYNIYGLTFFAKVYISSTVGFTKTRAFATKSCQNISTTVGFTKTKVCQLQNHIIVKKDQFDAKGS